MVLLCYCLVDERYSFVDERSLLMSTPYSLLAQEPHKSGSCHLTCCLRAWGPKRANRGVTILACSQRAARTSYALSQSKRATNCVIHIIAMIIPMRRTCFPPLLVAGTGPKHHVKQNVVISIIHPLEPSSRIFVGQWFTSAIPFYEGGKGRRPHPIVWQFIISSSKKLQTYEVV